MPRKSCSIVVSLTCLSCTLAAFVVKAFKPCHDDICLTHRELLPYNKEFGPTRISL